MSLNTSPAGSSEGPDCITPRHLLDMLAGAGNDKLISSLTDFDNTLLLVVLILPVREIIFGSRHIVLQKKDGGRQPIAIGCTLRRLAAKCAKITSSRDAAKNAVRFKLEWEWQVMKRQQVHVIRRISEELQDDEVLVK